MQKIVRFFSLMHDSTGRSELVFKLYNFFWPLLRPVAWLYRRIFIRKTTIVVVVGSLGKTTTTRAIRAVLGLDNDNKFESNAFGAVARKVFQVKPQTRHAVIEVGIAQKGQMRLYAKLLRPNIVVMTSIASEHSRNIGGLEQIREEKVIMFKGLASSGVAIINGDDENVLWMQKAIKTKIIRYGLNEGNTICGINRELNWPKGICCEVTVGGQKLSIQSNLTGNHMVYPLLAAVAVGNKLKISAGLIVKRLEQLRPAMGRLQIETLANGAVLIRDEFKSSKDTIYSALNLLEQLPGRKILVLGDIDGEQSYRATCRTIGGEIGKKVDMAFFISDMEQDYAAATVKGGLPREKVIKTKKSWKRVVDHLPADFGTGDVLLIKGRREQRLERLSLYLMGKNVTCAVKCLFRYTYCDHCVKLNQPIEN